MKARRRKLLRLVCIALPLLYVLNVHLERVGYKKHSRPVDTPVTFIKAGEGLCMIENGRTISPKRIGGRAIVGYSEESGILMLLFDEDDGERYFSLRNGKLTPVLHRPHGRYEVYRYGYFFHTKYDAGKLWLLKYGTDGKLAGKTRLQYPYDEPGYGLSMDISKSGDIAAAITDRQGSRDYIFLFDKEGNLLRRLGAGDTPSFSPDGKSIAYCTKKFGVLGVYHIPDGKLTRYRAWTLPHPLWFMEIVPWPWLPASNYGTGWSKDGKWLFCGMSYCMSVGGLHAVNLDNGDWSLVMRGIYPYRDWIAGAVTADVVDID